MHVIIQGNYIKSRWKGGQHEKTPTGITKLNRSCKKQELIFTQVSIIVSIYKQSTEKLGSFHFRNCGRFKEENNIQVLYKSDVHVHELQYHASSCRNEKFVRRNANSHVRADELLLESSWELWVYEKPYELLLCRSS